MGFGAFGCFVIACSGHVQGVGAGGASTGAACDGRVSISNSTEPGSKTFDSLCDAGWSAPWNPTNASSPIGFIVPDASFLPPAVVVHACERNSRASLELAVYEDAAPPLAGATYVDEQGSSFVTSELEMQVTHLGAVGSTIDGTFDGTFFINETTTFELSGSFDVCRVPDAP